MVSESAGLLAGNFLEGGKIGKFKNRVKFSLCESAQNDTCHISS